MSKKSNVKVRPHYSGPLWNAQSRQFPGISVSGVNEAAAEFIFRKMAKGSRKDFYRKGNRK